MHTLRTEVPVADDHLRPRSAVGPTPRSRATAEAGLPNAAVSVIAGDGAGLAVGMARAVAGRTGAEGLRKTGERARSVREERAPDGMETERGERRNRE